jgi:nitrogen fixation NifU-like protein
MNEQIEELYQAVIIDHNKRPRHYGVLAAATHRAEGHNPLCGDKVDVYLQLRDGVLETVQFTCASCAICKASASLMATALQGCTLDQVNSARESLSRIFSTDTEVSFEREGELAALSGVRAFPARIQCATLPWETVAAALRGEARVEIDRP